MRCFDSRAITIFFILNQIHFIASSIFGNLNRYSIFISKQICNIVYATIFYAILDMQDFEKTQATIRLMNELAKGRSENLSLTGLVLTVYHSLVHYFLCTL